LEEAVDIFGKGKVSTHLIVGLGETENEMVETIQKCVDMGVLPALFAFTPIPGTALENNPQPPVQQYRCVQLARHLIFRGITRYEDMSFDGKGCITHFGVGKQILLQIIQTGEPFLTSGCPDCNRPYYNEKPSGPIYNYPRPLAKEEITKILRSFSAI
jgi:biotin synthase